MGEKLTEEQTYVLQVLRLRPHGAPFRGATARGAVLALADRQLVCDPHEIGDSLFTRITDAGRAALSTQDTEARND